MDLLGIQKNIDDLASKISALEAKTTKDVGEIVSQVLAGVSPLIKEATDSVNTATLTINAGVTEVMNVLGKLDGTKITLNLGPGTTKEN